MKKRLRMSLFLAFLFAPLSLILGQPKSEERPIYFDIEARNVSELGITDTTIEFDRFKFNWGNLGPHATANFNDRVPRAPPDSLILSWIIETERKIVSSNMKVPSLPDRFTGDGSKLINGRYEGEGLLLRFDIDPEAGTACAVWTDNPYPANNVRCR